MLFRSLVNFLNVSISTEDFELFLDKILFADIGKETASPEMKTVKGISDKSVGRWKTQLDDNVLSSIMPIIEDRKSVV